VLQALLQGVCTLHIHWQTWGLLYRHVDVSRLKNTGYSGGKRCTLERGTIYALCAFYSLFQRKA